MHLLAFVETTYENGLGGRKRWKYSCVCSHTILYKYLRELSKIIAIYMFVCISFSVTQILWKEWTFLTYWE